MLFSFRVIPDRGSWYEAQFDTSDLLYVYLDRKKRRRKFLTTTLFRALAFLDGDAEKSSKKDATSIAVRMRKFSSCSTASKISRSRKPRSLMICRTRF
jgi:DNA-directed RNA polymerase beta subunit